jgi:hypothetical protein
MNRLEIDREARAKALDLWSMNTDGCRRHYATADQLADRIAAQMRADLRRTGSGVKA